MKKYLFFGSGSAGLSIVNILVQTWLIYFFAPSSGRVLIPASVVGIIWFIGRVVDSLMDPIIGSMSDRCNTRIGKRLPFLAAAALPLALLTFLIFFEGLYGGTLVVRSIVLGVLLSLYYLFFTMYGAPYYGLIPDLSKTTPDRINMATSGAVFQLLGTGVAMIGAGYLIDIFRSGPEGFDSGAYVPAIGILAFCALVFFVICIVGLIPYSGRQTEYSGGKNLIETFRLLSKNKPFIKYLFGMNIFWGGFIIINISVPYYVTVLMNREVSFTSVALGVTFGVSVLSFPIINILAKKMGNRKTLVLCSLLMAAVLLLIPAIGSGLFPVSPHIAGLILMGIAGFPVAGLFLVPNAMIADLSDFRTDDGVKVGEAVYYGFQGLVLKLMVGLVTAGTGILFDVYGSSVDKPLGILLTGPIGSVFAIVATVTFAFFFPKEGLRTNKILEAKQ
jgi:GPH family glycoside/pentoside/hexuronide:cation symporter